MHGLGKVFRVQNLIPSEMDEIAENFIREDLTL